MSDLVTSEALDESFLPMEDGGPPEIDVGPQKSDDGLYVKFYSRQVPNLVKSWGRTYTVEEAGKMVEKREQGAGRLIVEDVDFIQIFSPADPTNKIDTVVSPKHKKRFPKLWKQYQSQQAELKRAGLSNDSSGTPLSVLPGIQPAQIEELKFLRVSTVERLAVQPDSGLRGVPTFLELREKARAFVKAAESAAPVAALQAQLDEQKKANEALRAQMADVLAEMKKANEAKPKK